MEETNNRSPDEKDRITVIIPLSFKTEIDNEIMNQKIRNFQDAYREILHLGFENFKKKRGKNKNGI